jgi:hypothetical protein
MGLFLNYLHIIALLFSGTAKRYSSQRPRQTLHQERPESCIETKVERPCQSFSIVPYKCACQNQSCYRT